MCNFYSLCLIAVSARACDLREPARIMGDQQQMPTGSVSPDVAHQRKYQFISAPIGHFLKLPQELQALASRSEGRRRRGDQKRHPGSMS